jgi:flavin-dependent dehydrogenase
VGKSIFNEIKTIETIVGDKKYILNKAPGIFYMLNRQEFICQLAGDAEKFGAEILVNDKIKSVDDLDGDYIIDASGCPSSIKKELGLNRGLKGGTYQQTLEDSNFFVSDTIKVFLTDTAGYYWIFPRNPEKKEINLGVGLVGNSNYRLKEMLEAFKKEQGIEGKINYVTGGLIPAGLQKPLRYKNILFVGDAGVGTFPLLGQGIYRALMSGEIAGNCIAAGHPEQYTRIIYQNFIKWDLIGKTFLRINYILNKIGKKSMFPGYHLYLDFWYSFH